MTVFRKLLSPARRLVQGKDSPAPSYLVIAEVPKRDAALDPFDSIHKAHPGVRVRVVPADVDGAG